MGSVEILLTLVTCLLRIEIRISSTLFAFDMIFEF